MLNIPELARGASKRGLPVLLNPSVNGFDGFVAVAVNTAARRILDSIETEFAELLETGRNHLLEIVQNAGNIPSGCGASPVTGLRRELD